MRQSWRRSNESLTSAITVTPYGFYYSQKTNHMLKAQFTQITEEEMVSPFTLVASSHADISGFMLLTFCDIHPWNFFHQKLFFCCFNTRNSKLKSVNQPCINATLLLHTIYSLFTDPRVGQTKWVQIVQQTVTIVSIWALMQTDGWANCVGMIH